MWKNSVVFPSLLVCQVRGLMNGCYADCSAAFIPASAINCTTGPQKVQSTLRSGRNWDWLRFPVHSVTLIAMLSQPPLDDDVGDGSAQEDPGIKIAFIEQAKWLLAPLPAQFATSRCCPRLSCLRKELSVLRLPKQSQRFLLPGGMGRTGEEGAPDALCGLFPGSGKSRMREPRVQVCVSQPGLPKWALRSRKGRESGQNERFCMPSGNSGFQLP